MSERAIPVDWKFRIDAVALHNGKPYTEENSVLFLCKDRALVPTLYHYRNECITLGCEQKQLVAIELLIERIEAWQREHPDLLKVADIEGDEALVQPTSRPA